LPIVILSKLPRGEAEGRNKEKHPSSKSAKRLGAIMYIEKEEFLEKPEQVKNLILSILQKPAYTMILDCKDKTLDIKDQGGKSIFERPVNFSGIEDDWKISVYPYNEDHFLFKLIYMAAKKSNKRVFSSDVFILIKGKKDTEGAFTYVVPRSFNSLISDMEEKVVFKENKRKTWEKLLEEFKANPFDVGTIRKFLEDNEYYRNIFSNTLTDYDKEVMKIGDNNEINVNKVINKFNTKIRKQSNGKIISLLKGKGPGRHKKGEVNIFTICVENVRIDNDTDEISSQEKNLIEAPSVVEPNFVTKEELKKEFETFKEEILKTIKDIVSPRKIK